MREVNKAGVDLIKSFESCRLKAYLDGGGVPTIGWGHTRGVKMGQTITQEQADAFLVQDMTEASTSVERLVKTPLTDNQFAALVSFQYNTGALSKSTMLKLLNAGQIEAAAGEFGKWVNDNGKRVKGLVRRREAERLLFLSEG